MQIELRWDQKQVRITREDGDPAYYGIRDARGESRLLYAIKECLKLQGYDMIKKRMWRDGHLVDDMQQYIRTRVGFSPAFAVWNDRWGIEGAEVDYNAGAVTLELAQLGE